MPKKTIIFATIALSASWVFANTTELPFVSSSVSKHPSVVEKANEITLQGISVDQILAEDGLKINLSTSGKLSIKHSKGLSLSRADDLDRDYVDGVVTFNKNLYDFGVVDHKVDAEKSREKALKLEYSQVFEVTLQKLLNTTNDVAKIDAILVDLELSVVSIKLSIANIKLRFTSGIGTVMNVRKAQLLLLDLETQVQTLQRERSTKLVILRDEFGLTPPDLKRVNQTINQFSQALISTNQGVDSMIGRVISYPRSIKIIDLEKSALNSQIKSLKSENMPQLNATITSIAYDITRGLDEYEVYGAINLSMPLFDSGLSNTKRRGLTHRIKVQGDILDALKQDKSLALNKLTKNYQNLQIEYNSAQQKQTNLSEKLAQLVQRMAVVDEGLISKLQTQLQLDETRRNLLAYPFYMQSLNIDYWSLNEQLLEKINIRPTY